LNVAAAENTTAGSFSVNSNISWAVTSSQTWLTLSSASGSNNASITLIATANPNNSIRTATITVSGTGVTSQTITVTQAAKAATEVSEVSDKANLLYPNPVKDNVGIRLSSEDLPSTIAVYNMKGQQVLLMQTTTSLTTIDMKNFLPGIYIIRIKTPNEIIYKKIMKD
jgi:hypothetical protein